KRAIVETLLVAPENVVVTPNGVDERFFSPARDSLPAARYFLFVGNDKPHKNLAVAIEAAARAGIDLATAGVTRFVSDDELVALYRGAIALVIPSAEEGFGLPAAEAMACGTPV